MAKPRVIPKILVSSVQTRGGSRQTSVRTREFRQRVPIGTPISQARILQGALADEIMMIFIDQQLQRQRDEALMLVEQVSRELEVPLTVGGSISSIEDADHLLRSGADRVCLGASAVKDTTLLGSISRRFGAQAVVASIDVHQVVPAHPNRLWLRERGPTRFDEVAGLVDEFCEAGAGQIHVHDMERDGSGQGLNLDLLERLISSAVRIPVVVSGGCGKAQDFIDAFHRLGVSGVAAGTFFATRDQGPPQVRAQAKNSGLNVRTVWRVEQ